MPRGSFKAPSARSTGLLIALALLLIAAGVVLFVSIGHAPSSRARPAPAEVIDIGAPPAPGDESQVQARVQMMDKDDPTRLLGELRYERMDPLGGGYYRTRQPRAWFYLRDGRTAWVRADEGRVRLPPEQQGPESGDMTGSVVLKVYPAPAEGTTARPIDPERDAPGMIATTDAVRFDTILLELSSNDPTDITTGKSAFWSPNGFVVRGDQVGDRLTMLRIPGEGTFRYDRGAPDAPEPSEPAATPRASAGAEPLGPATPSRTAGRPAPDPVKDVTDARPVETEFVGPPAPIKEDLYKATFSGGVTVTRKSHTLHSDTLEVWVRTIDNQLPPDAFPEPPHEDVSQSSRPPGRDPIGPALGAAVVAMAVATPPPPQPDGSAAPMSLYAGSGEDEITLTWKGSVVLTPLVMEDGGEAPPELADGNHLTARFTSHEPGGLTRVTLTDRDTGAVGVCASIEYRATSQDLTLASGEGAEMVVLTAPGVGRLDVPHLTVNLGSGVAQTRGGGVLASLREVSRGTDEDNVFGPPPPPPLADADAPLPAEVTQLITWADQGDFEFRLEDGRIDGVLSSAAFSGDVLARNRASILTGDYVRAEFTETKDQPNSLKRLRAQGNVLGVAGPDEKAASPEPALPAQAPYLRAESLVVDFRPGAKDPTEPEPVRAVAEGSVRGSDSGTSLRAASVVADLAMDKSGDVVVTDALARGGVTIERRDGLVATADEVRASQTRGDADLTGQVVALAHGPTVILGTAVHLEEAAGLLRVHGAGTFEHTQPAPKDKPLEGPTRVTATWTKEMVFENTTGRLGCDGQVEVLTRSAFEDHTVRGERVRLALSPEEDTTTDGRRAAPMASDTPATTGTESDDLAAALDDRRLLRAEVMGSVLERDDGANATVQVLRYASAAASPEFGPVPERPTEQVMYLEGARIIADHIEGTLSVPSAGQGVVFDGRNDSGSGSAGSAASPLGGSSRGAARFRWDGTMRFDRSAGKLELRRGVDLTHKPLGGQAGIRMTCADLDAFFGVQGSGAGLGAPGTDLPSGATELKRAEATGSVYAVTDTRELRSDRLEYDAAIGLATATALRGGSVTVTTQGQPAALVATRLRYDVVRDSIEILEAAPVSAPR